LKASGQFRNCGIKKCCAEHDRPEISENEKRDLITTDNLEEESLQPKKETFNRQDLLDLMKEKGIVKISRNPQDSEQLLIEYDDGQTEN
jgi:hypothetical protein